MAIEGAPKRQSGKNGMPADRQEVRAVWPEADTWAAATFSRNFPDTKTIQEDIRTIASLEGFKTAAARPTFLLGGPPYQGFSIGSRGKDPKDPRNSLFREFIRFASIHRPSACLIENVTGLLPASEVSPSDQLEQRGVRT